MKLDADEYMHLALHAVNAGDHHAALGYLKEVLELKPEDAAAHYLLAAEHAELGLFERAAEGMVTALTYAPELDIARFQLGLLYMQLQRIDQSRDTFAALANRSEDASLSEFSQAFVALFADRQADAIQHLQQGLQVCDHNPALKGDMTRVLENLSRTDTQQNQPQLQSESAGNTSEAMAIFLGAYRDSLEKP